jgi:(E)-4-hydroxy-3-methylbut-2-enyl-diphosphate synthase
MKYLLSVPVGVLCRPGEHVPEGATLLYEAAAVKDALPQRLGGYALTFTGTESAEEIGRAVKLAAPRLILLRPENQEGVTFLARRFFSILTSVEAAKALPAMLWFSYPRVDGQDQDDVVIKASADFGSLFVDGLGEGILWDAEEMTANELREASFNLLQASRMRITKTEFISCPSCGRTLFNLQDTTKRIQAKTGHLPGVRIAVMGCIVNGPGEMADADFGYVGSGPGKIDLYVGYDCVQRGIPQETSVDRLVDLIKEHGRWVDPPEKKEGELQAEKVPVSA